MTLTIRVLIPKSIEVLFCLFPDSCNLFALGSCIVSCTRGNFHSPSIQLPVSSLYFKAKTQWNKGMTDFDSGNSVNCVGLDINLYETKREK